MSNRAQYWYITAGIYAVAVAICFLFYNPPLRDLQATLTFSEKVKRVSLQMMLFTSLWAALTADSLIGSDTLCSPVVSSCSQSACAMATILVSRRMTAQSTPASRILMLNAQILGRLRSCLLLS